MSVFFGVAVVGDVLVLALSKPTTMPDGQSSPSNLFRGWPRAHRLALLRAYVSRRCKGGKDTESRLPRKAGAMQACALQRRPTTRSRIRDVLAKMGLRGCWLKLSSDVVQTAFRTIMNSQDLRPQIGIREKL